MAGTVLSPLDDLPIHQIAEPIAAVGTSDRNFYNRYYFNLFCCDEPLFVTAGLGQYPNLGVVDGFAAATVDGAQYVVRASRELGDRRDTAVGPISVEVLEGLQRLRLRVGGEGPLRLDATWTGAIPAFQEAHHTNRRGPRLTTDTCRFAQTGSWEGSLEINGRPYTMTPDRWWGGRDRSWGVRPVGEPEPAGRWAGGDHGFLWLYSTMQFADFTVLCIVQEDRAGFRSLEQTARIWPSDSGRPPEPLGPLEHTLEFEPGTRRVAHATITFHPAVGEALTVEVDPVGASYLALGTGYGMDADWRHGMYQGPLAVQNLVFDLHDAATSARTYGLVDNLARFEAAGRTGYGLFENAVLGHNDRYGFGARR